MDTKLYVIIIITLLLVTAVNIAPDSLKAEETDTYPPEITSVNNSPDTVGFGSNITITPSVTDNLSGVNLVKVNITFPDNSTGNFTMNNTGNSTYEYIFSDTWIVGQYNYTIWATDNANNTNVSSQYNINVSAQANISVCTIKDEYGENETINLTDPPGDEGSGGCSSSQPVGYELLNANKVLHIWNRYNSYYFNTSSGIQLTNHYNEYWSHNVLMLGYYNNDEWNLIYRTDELSGFNKDIDTDNETFVNVTLWKNLIYGGYDFRLAIRYHLGVNDSDLTVIPYIKNIDDEDIPYVLGFGWELKDIRIANVNSDNYLRIFNGTGWEDILLNRTLDEVFIDMDHNTTIRLICTNPPIYHLSRDLYLSWDENLTYKVTCKSRTGQYNALVTLFIKIGTVDVDQEKYTQMYWLDSDDWLGISSSEHDSCCGSCVGEGLTLENALDGTMFWQHMVNETHWFILDLGQTYTVKKVRGRSQAYADPTSVNVYVSDSKTSWGTAVATGISTWYDIPVWQEVDTTDKNGRYVKVEINATEDTKFNYIEFGGCEAPFTIFDVYGDIPDETPVISNPYPVNNSTGVSISPLLNITVSDPNSDNMNISWLSNSSGSWQVFGTNDSVGNGTYHQTFSNATTNGQWWYWKVNVSDGTNYTESSVYKFYTGCETKIENTGSTNISGYLFMQVQYYSDLLEDWIVVDDTIDEDTPRTINAGEYLALDTIFNGLVNSSKLRYGNGTYRVYVAFRDPNGNVLMCDDESLLETGYGFSFSRAPYHWVNLHLKGFGSPTNQATRGMEIYNGELYVGTQNFNKTKFWKNIPGSSGCNGFLAGTRIKMANGSYKDIEDIEVDDQVKAYDMDNNSNVTANVTEVYCFSDEAVPDHYVTINNKLHISPNHLLYVNGTLTNASDVVTGDFLVDVNGSNVTVNSSVEVLNKKKMYNLRVSVNPEENPFQGNLTYFAEDIQVYPLGFDGVELHGDLLLALLSLVFVNVCIRWLLQKLAEGSDGCEVWKYNYNTKTWTELVGEDGVEDPGFGDKSNWCIGAMKEFDGKLYVGTWQSPVPDNHNPDAGGGEIWRYDGSTWEPIIGPEAKDEGGYYNGGFNYRDNLISCMEVFENSNGVKHLYVGTCNLLRSDAGGCQVWRTATGGTGKDDWEKVVTWGFRKDHGAGANTKNSYVWSMEEFYDKLYVGTFNSAFDIDDWGCQLWRTATGGAGEDDWEKVELPKNDDEGEFKDGFGEWQNYGIRSMVNYSGNLYCGTGTYTLQFDTPWIQAIELWKYDGTEGWDAWECIVGDTSEGSEEKWDDGFGDKYNKYLFSMAVCGNELWAGTSNNQIVWDPPSPILPYYDSKGCEVWRYDGENLNPSVKNGDEIGNGFDNKDMIGARSLIEFPAGSGKLVVGTYTFNEDLGCEVWIRYP